MKNITPLNKNVLIETVQNKPKAGEIFIPDSAFALVQAVVIAVGEEVTNVKQGDKVVVGSVFGATTLTVEDKKLQLVSVEQILAKYD